MAVENTDIDRYIREHRRSMTQREIASRLGISKSTVSRRLARMRGDGELDDSAALDAREASEGARAALQATGMTMLDRLSALEELRDRLRDELGESGGASLARVASEYRRTLEEIESLSAEAGIVNGEVRSIKEFDPAELARLRVRARKESGGGSFEETFDAVIGALNDMGAIKATPLSRILADPDADPVDKLVADMAFFYEDGDGDGD